MGQKTKVGAIFKATTSRKPLLLWIDPLPSTVANATTQVSSGQPKRLCKSVIIGHDAKLYTKVGVAKVGYQRHTAVPPKLTPVI
jgi:hypothetical protein